MFRCFAFRHESNQPLVVFALGGDAAHLHASSLSRTVLSINLRGQKSVQTIITSEPVLPCKVMSSISSGSQPVGLKSHLCFTYAGMLLMEACTPLCAWRLLVFNGTRWGAQRPGFWQEAFFNGLRFDLRLVVLACLP